MRKWHQCTCSHESSALIFTRRVLIPILYTDKQPFSTPRAVHHGLTNTVLKFLDLGVNIQATLGVKRATALYLASRNGHLLIVEALIQSGAEIGVQTSQGVTSLHGAVEAEHEHITRVLLENGADFMKPLLIRVRPTILHIARHFEFIDIVRLLLDKRIDIQVKNENLNSEDSFALRGEDR